MLKRIEQPKWRLLLSVGVGALVFVNNAPKGLEFQLLAAWVGGAICFLIVIWSMMLRASAAQTRCRSQQQEVDHRFILMVAIAAAFASLFVIGFVLGKYKDSTGSQVSLSIAAVFCSWLLVHTLFAHHYAAFYYRPCAKQSASDSGGEYNGGLKFAGEMPPRYSDFLYFSFVIGMSAQTSDIPIVKSAMRRLTVGHMIVSYYFYSVILALAVSLVTGLF